MKKGIIVNWVTPKNLLTLYKHNVKTVSGLMVDVCKNIQVLSVHHQPKEVGPGDLETQPLIMCP